MKVSLGVAFLLTVAVTFLACAEYAVTKGRQDETRGELRHLVASKEPVSEAEIEIHVSRIGSQGRRWGLVALSSGGAACVMLGLLLFGWKRQR